MIAAGTILPLMDLVFGKFINVFTDFATGVLSPAGYRSEVSKYRYCLLAIVCIRKLTIDSLYFIYLFIAKFALTYLWTVSHLYTRSLYRDDAKGGRFLSLLLLSTPQKHCASTLYEAPFARKSPSSTLRPHQFLGKSQQMEISLTKESRKSSASPSQLYQPLSQPLSSLSPCNGN